MNSVACKRTTAWSPAKPASLGKMRAMAVQTAGLTCKRRGEAIRLHQTRDPRGRDPAERPTDHRYAPNGRRSKLQSALTDMPAASCQC